MASPMPMSTSDGPEGRAAAAAAQPAPAPPAGFVPPSAPEGGYPPAPPLDCALCGAPGTPVGTPGVHGWVYYCAACERPFTARGRADTSPAAPPAPSPLRLVPRPEADDVSDDALLRTPQRVEPAVDLFGDLTGYHGPASESRPAQEAPPSGPARRRLTDPRPCRLCGEMIVSVTTERGKQMPCDMYRRSGDGRRTLVDPQGRVHVRAEPGVEGYEPHFGTCVPYLAQQKAEAQQRAAARHAQSAEKAEAERGATPVAGSALSEDEQS